MRVVQLLGIDEKSVPFTTGALITGEREGPELIIVRSGSIELRTPDGKRKVLGRGQAIIVQPGDNAELTAIDNTPLTRILLPADCVLE